MIDQVVNMQILNQFWMTLFLLIPVVLISRTVVAGSKYSPILIIVIFGLSMGFVLVQSGVASPGLRELPLVDLISRVTITALIVSFYSGGRELKRLLFKNRDRVLDDMVLQSEEEIVLGTKRTQFVFILRAFFILLGIEGLRRLIIGHQAEDPLGNVYPLIAYIGVAGSIILLDYKAVIKNKMQYIRNGLVEITMILAILFASHYIAEIVKPLIALPQIFFAMIISSVLGMVTSKWQFGPTARALMFAGIPMVLAANFMVGGSRILDALKLTGMSSVMMYGFFGQAFWMFGGISLLIFLGLANHVRNLAPGMAGSLSHAGLTGACTAGDMGEEAASRAPIMINIPFFGHVFVFSILAISAQRGALLVPWTVGITVIGVGITIWSLITLRKAKGEKPSEVKGLMLFSFGWQLAAVFGGLLLLYLSGMSMEHAAMAKSSSISHFGLFAALQGGMFGEQSVDLIPFIFAMPFLVHPLVFGMFGKAMENGGVMPKKIALALGIIGLLGIIYALFIAK